MGFFNKEFLQKRREEWKNSLGVFQYEVEGTWLDADIDSSAIEGHELVYNVLIPVAPAKPHTITGLRILGSNGEEAGKISLKIERSGEQSLLATFKFPIQEV